MRINPDKAYALMADNGLTISEVSRRGNISRKGLQSALKRGTCRPESLGRIAKGLGVTAEAIMIKEASQ